MSNVPNIKIFADGAVLEDVPRMLGNKLIKGFTTNPTLMAKAGVKDYEGFAKKFLAAANGMPVSLEVFADDLPNMTRQARILAGWGDNVFVKIPITTTTGATTREAIAQLSKEGVKLNVTAVFTKPQIDGLLPCFTDGVPAIVSIFAGRIADAGVDPQPTVRYCVEAFKSKPAVETLWASCREIFSVVRAAEVGCHVITVPNDMLKKLEMFGKDLGEISLDTVKMFYNDATSSGFQL